MLRDRVPPGALAGRIVFLGVSALGLGDVVATPLGTFLPGAEVHATVADNLLRGDSIRRPEGGTAAELPLVLVAAVGVALASSPSAGGGICRSRSARAPALARRGMAPWRPRLYISPLFPALALAGALGLAALHRLVAERARADQSNRQLRTAREMVLHALTSLTETRDFETGAHLVRTSRYARVLGRLSPPTRGSGASSRRRRST